MAWMMKKSSEKMIANLRMYILQFLWFVLSAPPQLTPIIGLLRTAKVHCMIEERKGEVS
jgi:hypothetical protein